MKEIKVGNSRCCFVDDEDFYNLCLFDWSCLASGYAMAMINNKLVYMHREIMKPKPGYVVDHIDSNKLNNQRSNLRVCSYSENCRNRGKQINNTSGFKGISWDKFNNKWRVTIEVMQKSINLGRFVNIEDAINAYRDGSIYYHGEFGRQ